MNTRRSFLQMPAALLAAGAQSNPASASVTVDPSRETGRIDPMVYGHMLEHLERVIYGGVFEPGSRFADDIGIRADVVKAIAEMGGARVLRWPGGNFVSYYRWKDGIGPREKRPKRYSVVWREHESNLFGTDEYLALCRKLGCDPFITVNMGTGALDEACEWVEYCRHGNRQPPVRIWGLGNEHYGPWQVGHYTGEEYGHKAQQYGQFMRAVSPDIELVAVGDRNAQWNEAVLKKCGRLVDWLTIHLYGHRRFLDGVDDFDSILAAPELFYRDMKSMSDQLDSLEASMDRKRPIRISLEEWNARHWKKGASTASVPGLLRESPRNIVDALFVAGVFNACHRLPRVAMSNYVFIVNAHGPLYVYPEGVVKTAVFDVFRLYATRMLGVSIPSEVQADTYRAAVEWERKDLPVTASRLDVSATRSPDGKKLAIALLNRHRDRACRVALNVKGRRLAPGGTLHVLTHPDLNAANTLARPDTVRSREVAVHGVADSLELAPHSVNVLEVNLA